MNTRSKVNLYRRLLRKAETELRTAMYEDHTPDEKVDVLHQLANQAYHRLHDIKDTLGLSADQAEDMGLEKVMLLVGEILETLEAWDQ